MTFWRGRDSLEEANPPKTAVSTSLGEYPTPVFRTSGLVTRDDAELWVKNDGLTHALYGGNKVRKLGPILDRAERNRCGRIITAGGAGSHHVLATTLFARQRGISTAAVLCPQPWTEHAEQTLRCALAWGLEAIPVGSMAAVPRGVLENWRSGDLVVPVGGWGIGASRGYAQAAIELSEQIADGDLPEPDVIVVALGSGGTAAGLLAGLAHVGLRARVLATSVAVRGAWLASQLVLPLAWRIVRSAGWPVQYEELKRRLVIDTTRLGAGYGAPTRDGAAAISIGRSIGLELDPTYTAKAFVSALALVSTDSDPSRTAVTKLQESLRKTAKQRPLRVLYWHTLAATSLEPLLAEGPADPSLSGQLRMLLQGS